MDNSQNRLGSGLIKAALLKFATVNNRLLTTCLFVITLMFISNIAQAHNKVVVVPMAGDNVPTQLLPFALIPADDTSTANYTSANGVTLDKVTGLEWQQVDSNVNYSFDGADDYCVGLTLGSKTDWRLPTVKELFSIVDLGTFSPAIDGTAFPATDSVLYWAVTDIRTLNNSRWAVDFATGEYAAPFEASAERARCVRTNGQNALLQVFKVNGDGSVTDLASGLIWQQQDDGVTRTQGLARTYCRSLVLAGSSNWRIPSIKELVSIIDDRARNPTIETQLFPATANNLYWSSPSFASLSSKAWAIDFTVGVVRSENKTTNTLVRCVR